MAKSKMPTIKNSEAYLTTPFSIETLGIESATKSKIVTADANSGDHLIFAGKGLRLEHGLPSDGVINKVWITSNDDTVLQTYANLGVNVDFVAGSTLAEFALSLISTAVLKDIKVVGSSGADNLSAFQSNDILLGLAGDDILSGGVGKDRLTGGDGNDTFIFSEGFGKDKITDFDADGGVGMQDRIQAVFADAAITQQGQNTIVDYGDGDVLTLIGVNSAQITAEDFTM